MIATTVDEFGTRRAVTKLVDDERLVSCTCCVIVCCMYPADQLGIGYTEDDLPDTIDVLVSISPTVSQRFLMSRNGSEYGPVTTTFTVGLITLSYDTYIIIETFVSGLEWFLLKIRQGTNEESLEPIFPCLFAEYSTDPDVPNEIEDTFEDTYSVTGPVNGTVTRQSRCVWTGTGLTLSNYGYHWTVNGRANSGNQNPPVGSYADGYSVAL